MRWLVAGLVLSGVLAASAEISKSHRLSTSSGLSGSDDKNLVVNGSFDDPTDPLHGWRYKYDLPGEDWYFNNHKRVSVVEREGSQSGVLRLHGNVDVLFNTGQGVKVDSAPMPYEYGKKYKVSVRIRSNGPGNRIHLIGYQWLPGIKPHPNPKLHELRPVYKGKVIFPFKESVGRYHSWTTGKGEFPGDDLSDLAKSHLRRVKFISLHVVAILCPSDKSFKEGDLFVDDVKVECLD